MFQAHKPIIILLITFFLMTSTFALPLDHEKAIHIVSDASFYDYKTGTKTYEGKVQVDQGTTHLIADKVVTQNNSQHKLEEAIAYGITGLAEYTTMPNEGEPLFKAQAKIIKFNLQTMIVTLEDTVTVTQGENSFKGPLIVYNMKEQTINAPASKSGRSTVVIEPKQLKL